VLYEQKNLFLPVCVCVGGRKRWRQGKKDFQNGEEKNAVLKVK